MATVTFLLMSLSLMHLSDSYPTTETDPYADDLQVRLWNYVRNEVDTDSNDAVDKPELRQWLSKSQDEFRVRQVSENLISFTVHI
jgi:hypothetical protein